MGFQCFQVIYFLCEGEAGMLVVVVGVNKYVSVLMRSEL